MNKIKCVKKPIVVEAIEIDDEFIDKELPLEINGHLIDKHTNNEVVVVHTLEGIMECSKGDFIIIGVNGECYPIKRDIFFKTYDIIPQIIVVNEEIAKKIKNEIGNLKEFIKN